MSCLIDYINKCPELAGSSMVGMNFTEIELQGGIDVYCELVRGELSYTACFTFSSLSLILSDFYFNL